jgi:hypothetical protein
MKQTEIKNGIVYYQEIDGGVSIIGFERESVFFTEELVLDYIDGKPIIEIDSRVYLSDDKIKSIVLPYVKKIKDFFLCPSLESFVAPLLEEVGDGFLCSSCNNRISRTNRQIL